MSEEKDESLMRQAPPAFRNYLNEHSNGSYFLYYMGNDGVPNFDFQCLNPSLRQAMVSQIGIYLACLNQTVSLDHQILKQKIQEGFGIFETNFTFGDDIEGEEAYEDDYEDGGDSNVALEEEPDQDEKPDVSPQEIEDIMKNLFNSFQKEQEQEGEEWKKNKKPKKDKDENDDEDES